MKNPKTILIAIIIAVIVIVVSVIFIPSINDTLQLLSKEWNVSNSTAKEMVHAMHQLKEQDNVKKSFQNIKEIDELGRD